MWEGWFCGIMANVEGSRISISTLLFLSLSVFFFTLLRHLHVFHLTCLSRTRDFCQSISALLLPARWISYRRTRILIKHIALQNYILKLECVPYDYRKYGEIY
jgi:hypothetical protein